MTDRINKLREQSLNAVNRISAERAVLVTEFYETAAARRVSVPVCRAMALDYILSHKHICINEGELIVGERGPAPKACPTYPEVCLHTIEDLEMLDSRKKVSFKANDEVRRIYQEKIILSGPEEATVNASWSPCPGNGILHTRQGFLLNSRNRGRPGIRFWEARSTGWE